MSWLNTNYILRAGVLSVLLLLPGLMSATCKRDTIINNYKDDSLRFIIKDDSIITFRNGESSFTIIKADSVLPATPKHTKHTRYDNRVHRFRRNWERIIPTHSKIQYAGNMGLLSFGTGWDYGKRNQWETDVLLGFIPKYSSKKAKVTMTLKQNYMPWSINIGKGFSTEPLACGLYVNTVFGNQFWVNEPEPAGDGSERRIPGRLALPHQYHSCGNSSPARTERGYYPIGRTIYGSLLQAI